ncbi:MAG: WbqC family protein [Congregibacter sp.]
MHHVDTFVVYDDVQFTKKGWIHRNRFQSNGSPRMFTLPLKKDSDYLDIVDRKLAESWKIEKRKLARRIEGAYGKSPHFQETMDTFAACLEYEGSNLFDFVFGSINIIRDSLDVKTRLLVSSEVGVSKKLRGQERVLEFCRTLGATEYVNPIGGYELYDRNTFAQEGVELKFHKIGDVTYDQAQENFVPNLSILDMLMICGVDGVKREIENFEILE